MDETPQHCQQSFRNQCWHHNRKQAHFLREMRCFLVGKNWFLIYCLNRFAVWKSSDCKRLLLHNDYVAFCVSSSEFPITAPSSIENKQFNFTSPQVDPLNSATDNEAGSFSLSLSLSRSLSLSMDLQPFGPLPLFRFLNPIHSRWNSLHGGSARRKAATCTQNDTNTEKRTQESIPRVGFKPTTPVFQR
jgi:hypothetical protein